MRYRSILWLVLLSSVPVGAAELLTNDAIVALSEAGLGPEAIVAKIRTTPGRYDLTTERLVALKKAGVADPVIAAMLSGPAGGQVAVAPLGLRDNSADPLQPHSSGIYALVDWQPEARMMRIDATTSSRSRNSGFLGYALTGGIAKIKMKTVLPDPAARVRVKGKRPVFYFFFDQAGAGLFHGQSAPFVGGFGVSVTLPSEFSLVRFAVAKGTREAVIGQFNIGGLKAGVMDKARIAFTYQDVAPGVFRVLPEQDLAPGEYGFILSASARTGGVGLYGAAQIARVFDFAVLTE